MCCLAFFSEPGSESCSVITLVVSDSFSFFTDISGPLHGGATISWVIFFSLQGPPGPPGPRGPQGPSGNSVCFIVAFLN